MMTSSLMNATFDIRHLGNMTKSCEDKMSHVKVSMCCYDVETYECYFQHKIRR